ncbi:hypothetical protein LMG18102_02050 [Ralstonia mannitolilytica]|uniref:hypothetical protein n=1 Tax=Ralstonia mannitolilytica TaxID=105219 RepID=UPI0028F54D30|nr:hypothetical protein [Ralstonia mannitolilytica]CAJ0695026.1 hypothetical protein LMG18102_02050 [Ralstonia mannitolilytica]
MTSTKAAVSPDEEERTTATGLARYAYEYIDAALLVDEHHGARPGFEFASPVPAYFLAAHGIELTLKAYLRHQSISVRDLMHRYGHDLHKCYRKAKELRLLDHFAEDERDTQAMAMLAELNRRHELRYIRTGYKQFPSWAIVAPLAVRLHQVVAPLVGFHSFTCRFAGYK